MRFRLFDAFAAFAVLMTGALSPAQADPVPLTRVHAHNDYEHPHPLFDALEQGFCSVEADIYPIDGTLLVAHDRKDVKPDRTLQSLYLEPLRQRVKQNGGRVYKGGPECVLLIDFKSEPGPTYAILREVLKEYADIMTVFRDGKKADQRHHGGSHRRLPARFADG